MKKLILSLLVFALPFLAAAQCTTTNATNCVCKDGTGNCDLLPDIIVGRPPLLVNGSSGYTEYPQVCNPPCNGNDGRIRISVSTPNIGAGPLEVHALPIAICGTDTFYNVATNFVCPNGANLKQVVQQRIYHKTGSTMSYYDRNAGTMTYHPSHGHMHVDDWGIYTLRTATADPDPLTWPVLGNGAKLAFCLMDYGTCTTYSGHCVDSANNTLLNGNFPNFGLGGGAFNCSPTVQGISSGYCDIYYQSLDGMWINVPPGLCNGQYWVVVQIDPHNNFLESNENNNVIAVPITLTQQTGSLPVITAGGPTTFCQGGSVVLSSTQAADYLWSNGATTQSITVTQSGSYSVTVNQSSSCSSQSLPITITATTIPVSATASQTVICPGNTVQLSATATSSGTATQQVSFSNNTQYMIPDNNSAGVSSVIAVSGLNPATLTATSIVSVTLNLNHTYDGDLQIVLTSPSGSAINLSNRRGGSGDNFTSTVFSATAAQAISSGSSPFTGSYQPDGAFSALTGNINGNWTLTAIDLAAQDTGRILNWSIQLNNSVATTLSYNWSSVPAGFNATGTTTSASPTVSTNYIVNVTESGTGCTGTANVNVNIAAALPITVSGNTTICSGNSTTLTASGATIYTWSPSTGLNTTSGATVIANPTQTTTYHVVGANTNGCTGSTDVTVTVNNIPAVPNVSGVPQNCLPVTNAGFSASADPTVTNYLWTVPSGVTINSGQGTNTISLNATTPVNGTICVVASNTCGNSNAACSVFTAQTAAPTKPGGITGASRACKNDVAVYSFPAVANATFYNWTTPTGATIISGQNTNSVTIKFDSTFVGGINNLSVTAGNGCGISLARTKNIALNTPTTPTTITGPASSVCQSTQTYSVPAVSGMIYNWTSPPAANIVSGQGTNTVQIYFTPNFTSGTIAVTVQNNCGVSSARTKTVKALAAKPANISGPTSLCASYTSYTFSTVADPLVPTYQWTVPAGSTILSGQGTASITMKTGATPKTANVTVKAINACGNSGTNTLAVTISSCPKLSDQAANGNDILNIYPNPAHDQVEIIFNTDKFKTTQIRLYNILGQVQYDQTVVPQIGSNSYKLNIRKFPAGVYLVSLDQDGHTYTQRLVIE